MRPVIASWPRGDKETCKHTTNREIMILLHTQSKEKIKETRQFVMLQKVSGLVISVKYR
jgi:hypothetical protein